MCNKNVIISTVSNFFTKNPDKWICSAERVAMDGNTVTPWAATPFPNLVLFVLPDTNCGPWGAEKYNSRVDVLKDINPGDVLVNLTVTQTPWSTPKQYDSQNAIDLCLVDTESDIDGSIIFILRKALGMGQECPIAAGRKSPLTGSFNVNNVFFPFGSNTDFEYRTVLYTPNGDTLIMQSFTIRSSVP